jgi:subtilisin family serine protease
MRKKCLRKTAAFLAVVLVLGCVQVSFADSTESSKGFSVIAASVRTADTENETSAASAASEEISVPEQNTVSDESEPDITLGDVFQGMSDSEAEVLNSMTYDIDEYENNEVLVMYSNGDLDVLSYNSREELEAGLESLDADENVESYQPNFSYEQDAVTQTLTNDTYSKSQWALSNNGTFTGYRNSVKSVSGVDTSAEKAWKYYTAKRDVIIALIDTGVQYTHSDLSGSFWTNTNEIAGNGIDDDGNGYVDDVNGWNFFNNNNQVYTGETDAHGTHCAGTISAAKNNTEGIAGLADYDNIKIMTLKALGGANGAGTTLSLARAIKYAEDNGASICNLSLGT